MVAQHERPVTPAARIRPVSGVRRQMSRQLASRGETQIAVLAREGQVLVMRNLVTFQALLVGECLWTFHALERANLFVVYGMLLELLVGQERALAVHADEFGLILVNLWDETFGTLNRVN